MPKSNPSLSPTSHHKPGSDEPSVRMSDVALRKKKNADAQAAFRARRANYIATLEETVTSLESVVLQLQDSCRETRNESQELRQENERLRHDLQQREKFWRALWQTRKGGQDVEPDDLPPLSAPFSPTGGHMGPLHLHEYGSGNLPYRINDDPSSSGGPFNVTSSHYQAHSSLSFSGGESDVSGDSTSHALNSRSTRFSPYPYPVHSVHRTSPWPTTSGSEPSASHSSHSSRSPNFVESPILTSVEAPFIRRFSVEDQKTSLGNLDSAPYVFPSSRSISPTASTPGSASSTSLTSFPFTFSDASGQDRSDFNYRRHVHPHGAEVTLHGGTADISLIGPASDTVRYRLGGPQPGQDRPLLPALPVSGSDNGSQHEHGSSDGDSIPYPHPRVHTRHETAHSRSRSPSPGATTISGTLAVIKAQAFGALRRTRARTKKSSEGAMKVAKDVLEGRGLVMDGTNGSSSKRQRLDDDDIRQL